MKDPNRLIRKRLRVKPYDSLPFTGWHKATRQDLAEIMAEMGYKTGAEIGVAQGTFSEVLCQTIPNLHLMCVDPWQAYDRISQELCDRRYELAVERLSHYNTTIIRKSSLEAAREIPDESLDFIYIDGAHDFDNVMIDLILWARKVRKGGIVSGHDYFHFYQSGVCRAVDAYTVAHGVTQWYITKEKEASWFWVKK